MSLRARESAWERLPDGLNDTIVGGGDAALATNATHGFLQVPTMAGTPTGTPATVAGHVALVFDTSGNKLWVYDGGWISATLS